MLMFSWLKIKKKPKYKFSDDDRELALERRRMRQEMKELEHRIAMEKKKKDLLELKEELEELKAKEREYDEYEPESSPENIFFQALAQKMLNMNTTMQQPKQEEGEIIPPPEFTDEEIDGIIENFIPKKYRVLAKILSEENLRRIILGLDEYGFLTEETATRIIKRLKQ